MSPKAPLIRDTLKDLGLAASKSRGQNFLKDRHQIDRICGAILKASGPEPELMEIGPGLGALTGPLLAAGAKIRAVELDKGLAENLKGLAEDHPGRLEVIHRDILSLGPDDFDPTGRMHLCGNLPYNISSPVLLWFLGLRRFFSGATFMLQKEMVERLCAGPGTKDYGRLTVALSLWCRMEKVLDVPPSAFHPRPKVESSVVAITILPPGQQATIDPETLGRFTAAAFAARRKTLYNNLAKVYGKEKSAAALSEHGLDPKVRAEVLDPPTLAALAETLTAHLV